MSRPKKSTAHIITTGDDTTAKCLHCGTVLCVPLPCEVGKWCRLTKAFVTEHADCPVPEGGRLDA